jgi:hypothetical protein
VPRWSYTLRGANWANVVDGFDHRPWARRLASVGEAHPTIVDMGCATTDHTAFVARLAGAGDRS